MKQILFLLGLFIVYVHACSYAPPTVNILAWPMLTNDTSKLFVTVWGPNNYNVKKMINLDTKKLTFPDHETEGIENSELEIVEPKNVTVKKNESGITILSNTNVSLLNISFGLAYSVVGYYVTETDVFIIYPTENSTVTFSRFAFSEKGGTRTLSSPDWSASTSGYINEFGDKLLTIYKGGFIALSSWNSCLLQDFYYYSEGATSSNTDDIFCRISNPAGVFDQRTKKFYSLGLSGQKELLIVNYGESCTTSLINYTQSEIDFECPPLPPCAAPPDGCEYTLNYDENNCISGCGTLTCMCEEELCGPKPENTTSVTGVSTCIGVTPVLECRPSYLKGKGSSYSPNCEWKKECPCPQTLSCPAPPKGCYYSNSKLLDLNDCQIGCGTLICECICEELPTSLFEDCGDGVNFAGVGAPCVSDEQGTCGWTVYSCPQCGCKYCSKEGKCLNTYIKVILSKLEDGDTSEVVEEKLKALFEITPELGVKTDDFKVKNFTIDKYSGEVSFEVVVENDALVTKSKMNEIATVIGDNTVFRTSSVIINDEDTLSSDDSSATDGISASMNDGGSDENTEQDNSSASKILFFFF